MVCVSMMVEFLAVGAGGFLGACVRYGLTKAANLLRIDFPLGTLLSNVIAGFFIGFIIMAEEQTSGMKPKTKLFLTTGLLGGLSTFSAFSLETVALFQNGKHLLAIGNILLNLTLSLLGVAAGMAFAKVVFAKV